MNSGRWAYFSNFERAANDGNTRVFLTIYNNPSEAPSQYTYREFWSGIEKCAIQLTQMGAVGNTVLIFGSTSIETYLIFFGAQMAGAVPSIMPPPTAKQDLDYYRSSHRRLIQHIEPHVVCGPPEVLARLDLGDFGGRVVAFDAFGIAKASAIKSNADVPTIPIAASNELALLQHSSGTTGLKKGVMLSYRAIQAQIANYSAALELSANDRVVSWLPLYHDMGLIACTVMPFVTATPLVVMDPFVWLSEPLLMMIAVQRHRCTLAWLPNFAFEHLANAGRRRVRPARDFSSLRMIINCSEVCRPESMDRFYATFAGGELDGAALHTCYALAENVFAATQSRPGQQPKRILLDALALDRKEVRLLKDAARAPDGARMLVSSGRPIDGCSVMVKTEAGMSLEEGRIGELLLRTDCMFDGYFGNRALSQERLVDGWCQTHDLGFIHDGEVYVLGRLDDVIIYRGRNVFAADLEAALGDIPDTKPGRLVAFGVYDRVVGSEQVVVMAETTGDGMPDEILQRIEVAVRGRLEGRFGINPLHVLPLAPNTLRKTTSGKISRVQNKEEFLMRNYSWRAL